MAPQPQTVTNVSYRGSNESKITSVRIIQSLSGTDIYFNMSDPQIRNELFELLQRQEIEGLSRNLLPPHICISFKRNAQHLSKPVTQDRIEPILNIIKNAHYIAADFATEIQQYFCPYISNNIANVNTIGYLPSRERPHIFFTSLPGELFRTGPNESRFQPDLSAIEMPGNPRINVDDSLLAQVRPNIDSLVPFRST